MNSYMTGALYKKRPHAGYVHNATWRLWESFCTSLDITPIPLPTSNNAIPLLQLFAQQYRTGAIAPGRHPVQSRTVEDAVQAVGQAYARMGSPGPRLNCHGKLDILMTSLYRAWQRDDEPPSRVKPPPLPVVVSQAYAAAQ